MPHEVTVSTLGEIPFETEVLGHDSAFCVGSKKNSKRLKLFLKSTIRFHLHPRPISNSVKLWQACQRAWKSGRIMPVNSQSEPVSQSRNSMQAAIGQNVTLRTSSLVFKTTRLVMEVPIGGGVFNLGPTWDRMSHKLASSNSSALAFILFQFDVAMEACQNIHPNPRHILSFPRLLLPPSHTR